MCSVVGLDFWARTFPGGSPVRDARHAELIRRFIDRLHPTIRWSLEVPLPNPGDQRAWDALILGADWRYGVEAELNPTDGQALNRRLNLKRKEGGVDGLILLIKDTRQSRIFRRELAKELKAAFPVPGRLALSRLSNGLDPTGNAIVIL